MEDELKTGRETSLKKENSYTAVEQIQREGLLIHLENSLINTHHVAYLAIPMCCATAAYFMLGKKLRVGDRNVTSQMYLTTNLKETLSLFLRDSLKKSVTSSGAIFATSVIVFFIATESLSRACVGASLAMPFLPRASMYIL
ncbi:hypothetical protein ACJX0J_014556 [Zea mays]